MKADSIVIGAGPCGVSTAIYLKRYGFNPIVIAKDRGALENVKEIENYYGFLSISGKELLENGLHQLEKFAIPLIEEEVVSIEYIDSYLVKTNKNSYEAKAIAISTGASKNKLYQADKFIGSGVSYCAICDGFFFRKKKIALIGNSNFMLSELEVLKNITSDITIFTNGLELEKKINDYNVVKDKILSFDGDDHLRAITTANNTYAVDGAFIAIGSQSGFSLAKHLGLALEDSYIKINSKCETNMPGIYAGGDAVSGLHQIAKAVSDGAIMATSISSYLRK